VRMRALTLLAAAVLGVTASLLVACGDRSHLIPANDAGDLEAALDQVAAATSAGDCATARAAVDRASGVLAKLPDGVDRRLRARLRSGIANLRARVPAQCAQAATSTRTQTTTQTQTQTTETQTTPTTTETTTTETTPTTTDTTPTTTETTPTTTDTTPTTPTTPDDSGGTGDDSGGTGGASAGGAGR
jgi:hypothetical protein